MRAFDSKNRTYTVKLGDTLSQIAQAQYGDAELADYVARANVVANPRLLIPGTVLQLPTLQVPDPLTLNYVVPGMKLIPQPDGDSCWYASARMLVWWRRHRLRQTTSDVLDPQENAQTRALRASLGHTHDGLTNDLLVALARRQGLELIPPQSPTAHAIDTWLRRYGPLWVDGNEHIVVIAGIRSGVLGRRITELLVYDPWPPKIGLVQWRTLGGWYAGTAVDARDTGIDVPAVFMHCPR